MADASLGKAVLRTQVDNTGLKTGLDAASRQVATFGEQAGRSIQDLGRAVTGVGRSLSVGLTLPIVGAGVAIVKTAGEFERSLNRVAALSGATGDSFEQLREQAKQLGATTQFSASQAADAMGFLAQAGFKASEIFEALPSTLNLAGAAQLDLARSADIVSNILTGFQLPINQLDRAVDVLTKTFTSANTDLSQLGEAFKFVGPVASAAGQGFEETAAALGLLSNAGLQAGVAGTGLRQILISLSQESEVFGVATRDAQGQLRPLTDILASAEEGAIGLEEAINVFGIRGGPAFLALVGQGAGALRTLTSELGNAEGSAKRIQEVQLQGLVGELTQLKSAAEGLAIAFGDSGLLSGVTNLVTGATGLVRKFAELNPVAQQTIIAVAGIAAAVGPIVLVTGSLITNIGTLIVTLPKVAAGFAGLKAAVSGFGIAAAGLLGPAGLLIAGAAAVAGLAYAFAGSRSDKSTLTGAVTEASAALASGDPASITGALDKVIAKADGPTRDALKRMQEDLRETGVVGVEAISAIAGALSTIELDTQIAVVQAQIAGLRASLAGRNISASPGRDVEGIFSAANIDPSRFRLDEALNQWVPVIDDLTTSFQAGYDALNEVQYDALLRLNRDWKTDTERVTRDVNQVVATQTQIATLYDELARLETARAAALAGVVTSVPAPPPASGGVGGGGGVDVRGEAARSAADVVRELGEAGAALNRMAALVNTADAQLAAAEGRFLLIEEAITEIVTDFPQAIGDLYEGLRERQARALAEVEAIDASRAPLLRAESLDAALRREQQELDSVIARSNEERAIARRRANTAAAEAAARAPLLRAETLDDTLRAEILEEDAIRARIVSDRAVRRAREAREAAQAAARAPLLSAAALDEALRAEIEEQDAIRARIVADRAVAANRALRDAAASAARAPLLRAVALDDVLSAEIEEVDAIRARIAADRARASGRTAVQTATAAARAPLLRAEDLDAQLREEQEETELAIARANESRAIAQARAAREAAQAAARAPLLRAEAFDEVLRAEQAELEATLERVAAERLVRGNRERRAAASAAARAPLLRAVDLDARLRAEQEEVDALVAEAQADRIIRANREAAARALQIARAPIIRAAELDGRLQGEQDDIDRIIADVNRERAVAETRRRIRTDQLTRTIQDDSIAGPVRLAAFRELQQVNADAAVVFLDLARGLLEAQAAAARVVRTTAELRAEEDALQIVRSNGLPSGFVPPSALSAVFGDPSGPEFRGIFGPGGQIVDDGTGGQTPEQRRQKAETEAAREQAAADRFAQTVVDSAFTFSGALVSSIRDGDIGAAFQAVLGGASGIFGASDIGKLDFLKGQIGIGALIGGALSLVSGIIGLFRGGSSQRDVEERRARGVSPSGAPAIEFNVNVQQSLNIQSLTDPAGRAAVDGLLNQTVDRILRVIESNVIPRIQRLEATA